MLFTGTARASNAAPTEALLAYIHTNAESPCNTISYFASHSAIITLPPSLSPSLSPLGSIFHVRVNTPVSNLEHALLYSIGVNLPAHRVGQLDRVLVLASPINDINIHAWDLNRVKQFMELEVGIRMELCSVCQYNQPSIITLIMERQFIRDCMSFLCRETRISQKPLDEKGIPTFPVPHKCGYISPPPNAAPPPPVYCETDPESSVAQPPSQSALQPGNYVNVNGAIEETKTDPEAKFSHTVSPSTPTNPPQPEAKFSHTISPSTPQPQVSKLDAPGPAFAFSDKDWDAFSDSGSHYLRHSGTSADRRSSASDDETSYPPRNVTRKNYESSIPAVAQPYLNFQPHLFSSGSATHFEAPYQISSRIIITDSGEVQYERNILGTAHGGFHFKKQVPLPPRRKQQSRMVPPSSSKENSRSSSPTPPPQQPVSSNPGSQTTPGVNSTQESPPIIPPKSPKHRLRPLSRTISDQTSHPKTKNREESTRRVSDDYVFIPQSVASGVAREPSHVISPSYVHESDDTDQEKWVSSQEREAAVPKEQDEDYDDILSLHVSLSQKVETQINVCPPSRPTPSQILPKPRPRVARRKTVNVGRTDSNGIQASSEDSIQTNVCVSNGERASPQPSVKIATRGNDQAGLLDHEHWQSGWPERGRIETQTVPSSPTIKPRQRPPVPKPRKRASTTQVVTESPLHSQRSFESERDRSRSTAVIGESEML